MLKWFAKRPMFTLVSIVVLFAGTVTAGALYLRENHPLPSFHACYVRGFNDQWAIFKPHWEYGEKLFALNLVEADAQPFLVTEGEVSGQTERLSLDNSYVVVAQFLDSGRGKVKLFDLRINRLLFEADTFAASVIGVINSHELSYSVYGGEYFERWTLDLSNWKLEEKAPNSLILPGQRLDVPENIMIIIEEKMPRCESWPGYAD